MIRDQFPRQTEEAVHPSARTTGKLFFDTYSADMADGTVVDIGAQDVTGSLREFSNPKLKYVGVDFVAAKGVDVVLTDPYVLPFAEGSVDIVVSSSCLEHCEMFWVLFLEILRILKPAGLFYMNVPSNGIFHRYPVDCWRFYPDSGNALVRWGQRNGYAPILLESFIGDQEAVPWNDFVAVFLKDQSSVIRHSRRMLQTKKNFSNGILAGHNEYINPREIPEGLESTWLRGR